MRKLAKSDKGSYCNQGKWINEPEYRKGYYDEYYNDDFDLIATDKGSSSYSEAESHNVSAPQEKKHFAIFRKFINACYFPHF